MRYDVVIIGGGLAGTTAAEAAMKKGLKCAMVFEGRSLRDVNVKALMSPDLTMFMGDRVLSADINEGCATAIHTQRLEDEPLEAKYYILATGKYFSKGIVADMDKVYEPVFGLDVEYDADRSGWFAADFADDQKFMGFGVKNYGAGRVSIDGYMLENVFAAGEVLSGITGIEADANEKIVNSALAAVANIK